MREDDIELIRHIEEHLVNVRISMYEDGYKEGQKDMTEKLQERTEECAKKAERHDIEDDHPGSKCGDIIAKEIRSINKPNN